jgi:DNA repair protein RecN (Recombination protein N)
LGNANFQLNILDLVAQNADELYIYKSYFADYQTKKQHLENLKSKATKGYEEKDFLQFQYTQLLDSKLVETEQQDLEDELNLINHSQEISEALASVLSIFSTEQYGVENQLNNALSLMRKVEKFMPTAQSFADRIYSSMIDIKDVSAEIESVLSETEFNPTRKQFVEERLNLIYSLEQKHKVSSVAELLDLFKDFEEKLQRIESFEEEIAELQKNIEAIENQLESAAKQLSDKRKALQKPVSEQVEQTLALLGMPNAKFEISILELENFAANGKDKVEFLFSANKNRSPMSIAQVASGGELSRLMLVIKSLVIASAKLPTIIFDEIDTGISGEIAKKMGDILQEMGENMQVITITHLPQIAAKGSAHYKVYKDESGETSKTNIVQLSKDERVTEIAQMISGANPSEIAIKSALELLSEP